MLIAARNLPGRRVSKFFHDKGLKNEPKRCKPCKHAKNERLGCDLGGPISRHQTTHRSNRYLRSMPGANHRTLLSFTGPSRLLPCLFSGFARNGGHRLSL